VTRPTVLTTDPQAAIDFRSFTVHCAPLAMILSDHSIREELKAGRIVIDPIDERDI
jgi:hypothetical protein